MKDYLKNHEGKWIAVMNDGEAFVEQFRERSPGTGNYLATLTPEPVRAMRFTSPEEASEACTDLKRQVGGTWKVVPSAHWAGLMSVADEAILYGEMCKPKRLN